MQAVHTAIWVSELEPMVEFFEEGLGFEYVKDFESGGVQNYFVAGDGGAAVQFKHEDGVTVEPAGIDHISISVDDTEALVDRLTDRPDCELVDGPKTVNDTVSDKRIAFVEIPDGYRLELEQDLGSE
jgi:lactoylglutathione lyase